MSDRPLDIAMLVVDDEAEFRESLRARLTRKGYRVLSFGSAREALGACRERSFHVALLDIRMPEVDGLTLLQVLKSMDPLIEVIMLTGHGSIETAISAMKLGAYDYLLKPYEPAELDMLVQKAYEKRTLSWHAQELEGKVARLTQELKDRFHYQNLTGKSRAMLDVFEKIEAAGRNRSTVMIVGESGTGKELVAKAIHYGGLLSDKPFVAVNCAALPKELIESELFGYKKGSFTGATTDSVGLFKAAEGGTLFLDEITEMAIETQAKLLRVLQERTVRPIGMTREIPVNVRLIGSSNRDLRHAIEEGKLREDLYYRLSVATIRVPPLRERVEDIPLLLRHFLEGFSAKLGRTVHSVDRSALEALVAYRWPGNVRELENVIESAFTFGKSPTITREDLPGHIVCEKARQTSVDSEELALPGIVTLKEAERILIIRALQHFKGNKAQASRALGISRKQFYVKLATYGIVGIEWK